MYYKVMKDGRVIDVLDKVVYLKWQPKHKIMVSCAEDDAQAILSSDGESIWHEQSLWEVTVPGYDTVELIDIDAYEFKRLKMLCGKTPEEIIDEYTLSLMEEGVL